MGNITTPARDPWPNPSYIVLPPHTITTIIAVLPWGSPIGDQTARARSVYNSGRWEREDADHVEQMLSNVMTLGHPTVRREDAQTALRVLGTALAGYTAAWPASVLCWDPDRDGPAPPPDWAPPRALAHTTQGGLS
jgi:hypothetical protein